MKRSMIKACLVFEKYFEIIAYSCVLGIIVAFLFLFAYPIVFPAALETTKMPNWYYFTFASIILASYGLLLFVCLIQHAIEDFIHSFSEYKKIKKELDFF